MPRVILARVDRFAPSDKCRPTTKRAGAHRLRLLDLPAAISKAMSIFVSAPMSVVVLASAVVSAVVSAGCTMSSSASAAELRIGAWNIEQLGSPERRSPPSRNIAQKPEDLARYIDKARVDVLALEEIGDTDGAEATHRNATLDRTFELLSVNGASWKYVLLPKKDTTETFQLTGVAWNTARLQLVGQPFRIPVQDDPNDAIDPWQRHPHALKFSVGSGQTDFVLIPLHMKSNVGGAATTSVQRAYEARALVEQLPAIRSHFADDDIVLLGDANCLQGTEQALVTYRNAGLRDLNAADKPTTFRGGQYAPAPFDRVLVPDQPELRESRFEVFAPTTDAEHIEHKKSLSDHFLITATIAIGPDDDAN